MQSFCLLEGCEKNHLRSAGAAAWLEDELSNPRMSNIVSLLMAAVVAYRNFAVHRNYFQPDWFTSSWLEFCGSVELWFQTKKSPVSSLDNVGKPFSSWQQNQCQINYIDNSLGSSSGSNMRFCYDQVSNYLVASDYHRALYRESWDHFLWCHISSSNVCSNLGQSKKDELRDNNSC